MANALAVLGGQPVRTRPFPSWPIYGAEEEQALLDTLHSGQWGRTSGPRAAAFEARFAAYQHAKFGVVVASGTEALRIALLAAGIQAGDEVIVPGYTFIATANAPVAANAVPIFADIDPDTYNLDPAAVEAAITPRTRAIIPVHMAGHAADMDALLAIAARHNLVVIEDAAPAHGCEHRGRRVGALGQAGCFSFQSSKNLNCGEGGIVLTNDRPLADAARAIHNVGRVAGSAWYQHGLLGTNVRMTEFQAAILDCQMNRLDDQMARREANAEFLRAELAKIPGIRPLARRDYATRHAWHLFIARFDAEVFGVPPPELLKAIAAEGIPFFAGYNAPLYRQPVYQEKRFGPFTGWRESRPDLDYTRCRLPVTDRACAGEAGWLAHPVLLGTRADMDDIVRACRKVYEQRDALANSCAKAEERPARVRHN